MPSLADSAVIFIMALILFGPKKLPQLARQLGKLMAEFRRASNEFRMQMEDELRIEEQKEHQAKVDAMAGPPSTLSEPEHPHLPLTSGESIAATEPIAQAGELKMMPTSTGLPVESAAWGTTRDSTAEYQPGHQPEAVEPAASSQDEATVSHTSAGFSSEEPRDGEELLHGEAPSRNEVTSPSETPHRENARA